MADTTVIHTIIIRIITHITITIHPIIPITKIITRQAHHTVRMTNISAY